MLLRAYRPGDCREMAALFYDTVHTVNARDYTPEQLDAWAGGPVDLDAWDRSFRAHTTLVAVADGHIVGFGDIAGDGYLDRLYVHKDWQGRGVATALCGRLEAAVPGPVTTHASITARPFLERRGYRVVRPQQVERRGVLLTNYVMVLPLPEKQPKYTDPARAGEEDHGMQLVPIPQNDRTPELLRQLLDVWERSVKATHLFLSGDEIKQIQEYVPQALQGVAHLVAAQDGAGRPAAFMGVEDGTLEMLFLAPEERGKGLGRRLLQYGIEHYAVQRLTVNEQNPQAKGFYEHMGFCVYKRTDRDEQGGPYPLLYMRLASGR